MASTPKSGTAETAEAETAEAVAFALMQTAVAAMGRPLTADPADGGQAASRTYLLGLYAECLEAAKQRPPADADGPGGLSARVGAMMALDWRG